MIYLIRAKKTDLYKIGYTNGDPEERMKSMQTGCPYELEIIETSLGGKEKEKRFHHFFKDHKTRDKGEWFKFDSNIIQDVKDKMSNSQFSDKLKQIGFLKDHREYLLKEVGMSGRGLHNLLYLAITEIMLDKKELAVLRISEYLEYFGTYRMVCGMPESRGEIQQQQIWRKGNE